MSVQIRRRREAASFLSTYVGAQGELLVDTTNNRVQVHDGVTPGGWPAARLADVTPGATGPQGAQGAQGPAGSGGGGSGSGAQGSQGIQGAAGATGSQGITGPQGAAGAQGATGQGVQGSAGAAGGTGPQGAQGAAGGTGSAGATGATGPAGGQGTQGSQGTQGTQGASGATGAAGSSVTIKGSVATSSALPSSGNALGDGYIANDTGNLWVYSNSTASGSVNGFVNVGLVRGPSGPQGATGPQGSAGATGSAGASGTQGSQGATGAGGATGPTGSQGASGTAGSTGATGPQGVQGVAGAQGSQGAGATGPQGSAGTQGATGLQGAAGPQGVADTTGATGPQGTQGTNGATGPQGATGAAGFARTQVSDASYTALTTDRSVAFIALSAARTITLPAASAYPAGAMLTVLDESGACSATNTLTIAAAGTDKINGAATAILASAFAYVALESNTSNKWTIVDLAGAPLVSPAFTGTPSAPTAAAGTNSGQLATTSFVAASFVNYTYAGQTYATASNATLTGTPTAPTQAAKDNSTKLATTAYADAAVAAVTARTQVSDAAYTAVTTDRIVAYIALTAARTVTLPAASAYPAGATLTIVDESGACSPTATITVAAAGSDLVNGAATAVLSLAYGYLALESNTSNKWTQIDFGGVGMATTAQLTNRNAIVNGNLAVNQRAYASNTALAAGAYGHDRWKAGSGGCTYTFAQAVPDTSATITAGSLVQVVEGPGIPAATMWLTWTGTASARVYQGSASSQTSPAYAAGTPATIGGTAVNVLAVSGLTVGTNTSVEVSGGSVGLVQLEAALPNAGPTRFERRPLGTETALCQRYFQRWQQPPLRGSASGGTSAGRMGMSLLVAMRAAPTATMNGNLPAFIPGVASTTIASVAANYATTMAAEFDMTLTSAIGSAGQCLLIYQSGTSSLDLSAEL